MSYDKTEVYKAEIEPIVKQLYELCQKHQMAMQFAICTCDNESDCKINSSRVCLGGQAPEIMLVLWDALEHRELSSAFADVRSMFYTLFASRPESTYPN